MVAAGLGCVPGQWIEPEHDVLAAVKLLVEELKADVNATDSNGDTALHGAVCRGADSVVEYLVDKGANLNARNKQGKTPLDVALHGIIVPIRIDGQPLIVLANNDHTAVVLKKLMAAEHTADSQTRAALP
jgi:Ankyrin repeats (many copies)